MDFNGGPSNTRRKRRTNKKSIAFDVKRATDEESSTSDVESNSDIERATTYTSRQLKDIDRILRSHSDDYYGILGLAQDCTKEEIRAAYKHLATSIHPDKNPFSDAGNAFKSTYN